MHACLSVTAIMCAPTKPRVGEINIWIVYCILILQLHFATSDITDRTEKLIYANRAIIDLIFYLKGTGVRKY